MPSGVIIFYVIWTQQPIKSLLLIVPHLYNALHAKESKYGLHYRTEIMQKKEVDAIIKSIDVSSVPSLEDAVIQAGLYPYISWQLDEFPKELHKDCGKGIGLWQYPAQFSKYIKFVHDHIGHVRSYAEVGVAAGGTFIFTTEFLRSFCGLERSWAVDIALPGQVNYINNDGSPFEGVLHNYLQVTPYASFVHGDCERLVRVLVEENEEIDLLLIDGDHSYEGVKKDFNTLMTRARHIVFHDIASQACQGVVRFWQEVKQLSEYDAYEFIDQYESVNGTFLGIGLLVRRE